MILDNVTNVRSCDKLKKFYFPLSQDFWPVSWPGACLWEEVYHVKL